MKIYNKVAVCITAFATLSVGSCKKLLVEEQRTAVTQQLFQSPAGIIGGINGVYGGLRGLWGTEGFTIQNTAGVDETLPGSGINNASIWNYQNVGTLLNEWGFLFQNGYQSINTLNGILQFGPAAFTDATQRTQYLAQAKFLRAFWMYHQVITFEDVPLHTTYITEPTSGDTRAPALSVYAQIIKDLTEASTELQVTPAAPFGGKAATRATALYLLGKAYLSRGWYYTVAHNTVQNALGNRTNPTVPANPSLAQADFVQSATVFKQLIDTKATYGIDLWQDYGDALKPANDYGKETLMVIDESSDQRYGNYVPNGSGGNYNGTNWFFRPNYPTINGNYPASGGSASLMVRDVANGRPFIRISPNAPYLQAVFSNITVDSRFDNSFQTQWISNQAGTSTPRGALTQGVDVAIWTPLVDPGQTVRSTFKGVVLLPPAVVAANQAAGQANPGTPYTNVMFPSLRKYDDANRVNPNDPSTRPYVLYKFSDAYLLAAEAYFKAGDNTNAAAMLNVLRRRAAYRPANSATVNAANADAMVITPAQVTLDFILDERSRELYGETNRWWDLSRTRSLRTRLQQYNTTAYNGYNSSTVPDAYLLRPIPLNQIQLVTTGPAFPQNPGY